MYGAKQDEHERLMFISLWMCTDTLFHFITFAFSSCLSLPGSKNLTLNKIFHKHTDSQCNIWLPRENIKRSSTWTSHQTYLLWTKIIRYVIRAQDASWITKYLCVLKRVATQNCTRKTKSVWIKRKMIICTKYSKNVHFFLIIFFWIVSIRAQKRLQL